MTAIPTRETARQQIAISDIIISPFHREPKQWLVEQIAESMRHKGWEAGQRIVIKRDNTLVEGRHRIEAARLAGITHVPFEYIPDGESAISYGLWCNQNGQLTAADDVFDLAELCWKLSRAGWTGQQVADELGWGNKSVVTQYTNIVSLLHKRAYEFAKNHTFVNTNKRTFANIEFANANLKESHFRAFLSALPCPAGSPASTYRAQMTAVNELLSCDKVTAKVAGQVADKHAWRLKLKQAANRLFSKEVPFSERKKLINQIDSGVFGKADDERTFSRFLAIVEDLNANTMQVEIMHKDVFEALHEIPDESIDLLNTDPPYMVLGEDWDQFESKEAFLDFTERWLAAAMAKVKKTGRAYISFSQWYQYDFYEILKKYDFFGFNFKQTIIWYYKNNNQPSNRKEYRYMYEPIFYLYGPDAPELNFTPATYGETQQNVWEIATPQSNFKEGKCHPAQKPLELYRRIITTGSFPGDTVLDCFAGSGTSGVICRDEKRKCILIEKDEANISIIKSRLYE